MYALLIEAAGGKVNRKLNLGGTPVCQAAMEKGDLDLYPEYTGTGLLTVLKLPLEHRRQAGLRSGREGIQGSSTTSSGSIPRR